MTLHHPTNKAKCLTINMNFNCQQVKGLMIPRGKTNRYATYVYHKLTFSHASEMLLSISSLKYCSSLSLS